MIGFVLQIEENKHYSEDTAIINRIIETRNWMYPNDKLEIRESKLEDLSPEIIENCVPVGSIEFANKALEFYGAGPMKPINIPKKLMHEKYLGRKAAIIHNQKDFLNFLNEWNLDRAFIKSNSKIKYGFPDIYTKKDTLFIDDNYFMSEEVDIVSEWRSFVYRGKLKGIKHYLGDEWTMPDKNFVEECIQVIDNDIVAYTIDIGVLKNGKSIVIEVHNFVSCGLYGFDDNSLIPMLTNGYKQELKNS